MENSDLGLKSSAKPGPLVSKGKPQERKPLMIL